MNSLQLMYRFCLWVHSFLPVSNREKSAGAGTRYTLYVYNYDIALAIYVYIGMHTIVIM